MKKLPIYDEQKKYQGDENITAKIIYLHDEINHFNEIPHQDQSQEYNQDSHLDRD